MSTHLTALIADDHDVFREALKSYLTNDLQVDVISETKNGLEALTSALILMPDIAILDFHMPYLNGLDVCKQIKAKNIKSKIIIYSFDADVLRLAVDVADEVIAKESLFEQLANCLNGLS